MLLQRIIIIFGSRSGVRPLKFRSISIPEIFSYAFYFHPPRNGWKYNILFYLFGINKTTYYDRILPIHLSGHVRNDYANSVVAKKKKNCLSIFREANKHGPEWGPEANKIPIFDTLIRIFVKRFKKNPTFVLGYSILNLYWLENYKKCTEPEPEFQKPIDYLI